MLASVSFADVVNVSCPVNKPVEVAFWWSSTENIVVATNKQSLWLPNTSGAYSFFKLPADSGSSGVVAVVYSAGALESLVCTESYVDVQGYNFLMGLAGILAGGLLMWALIWNT